jgi:hypothetical protein
MGRKHKFRDGWLWGGKVLSDVTVRLLVQPVPATQTEHGSDGEQYMHSCSTMARAQCPIRFLPVDLKRKAEAEAGQQQDVHCHKVVLCSSSPGYWRRRILAWLPSAAPDADPAPLAAKRCKASTSKQGKVAGKAEAARSSQVAAASSTPVLEEHCTPEELPACLAVLQHAYTEQMPEGADVELLCRVGGGTGAGCKACHPEACHTSSCTHAPLHLCCTACRWH